MKKRALISVSDKTGVIEFARGLKDLGYEIVSTGGTESAIRAAGIPVINISDVTGFPECLDGRVKTLHPAVHAGLLALRDNPAHMQRLAELNINTIDLVAVNLYPFAATISRGDATFAEAVENIDIGGPTMIRSAAKNYKSVLVVVNPSDYAETLKRIADKSDDETFRKTLMFKAYRHTAVYDSVISNWLQEQLGIDFAEDATFAYKKVQDLRYGENPAQKAAFYRDVFAGKDTLAGAEQLWGKELSFNNINDANGAIELLKEFYDEPACVAIKHTNPCGAAVGKDVYDAYVKAYECDKVSIFGGIVAFNREVNAAVAQKLAEIFLEIIIAPSFSEEAIAILTKKKNLRLLVMAGLDKPNAKYLGLKRVSGGLLLQDTDDGLYSELKVVTKKAPTEEEIKRLLFAYKVVKHTKSNAIVLENGFSAVGVGAGQTNRIWAAQQAIEHAGERAKGAVAASDAFFPFDDCVEALGAAGITAIIQPGGSVRDEDSIAACDRLGIAMIFAGDRHFKH